VSGIYGLGPSQLDLIHTGDITSISSGDPAATFSSNPTDRKEGVELSSNPDELVGTLISQAPAEDLEEEMVDPDSAYDSESASVIRLSNGMVRQMREIWEPL
jgi:hypothetical protein